jgi:hypothetical protein
MEALIPVATLGGPMMFARICVMRALNRPVERACSIRTGRAITGDAVSWRPTDDWMCAAQSLGVPIAATLVSPNGHMRLRPQPNFVDRSFPVFQTEKE